MQKGQNKLISRPSFKTLASHNSTYGNKNSFQDLLSRPLYQSIANRVKGLNSKYYLPTHEQTKVISDPEKALRDQPQEVSSGPATSIQVQSDPCGTRKYTD